MGKKILLDAPTADPALGYKGIAKAFAEIIGGSQPNFAIGIFGGWGSGKTTLMGAIKNKLPTDGTLTVDFNAWRFEREPQLLVPLLDTIRGALADRAKRLAEESKPDGSEALDVAVNLKRIAGRVGRVVKALATGLSGSVGIPGAVTINLDAGAAIRAVDALAAPDPDPDSEDISPKSLYVAAFGELKAAFEDLDAAGVRRIVVFVDDLDRCLPANALDVLESMKLFFDLPGFIFVVGLDENVIDGAIAAKLTATVASPRATAADNATAAEVVLNRQLGREYAKKIFQVPYTLPVMLPDELDSLLMSMYTEAGITGDQRTDLDTSVRPYLEVIAFQRRVNPREVKRFINSYTLQTLIRPRLKAKAVLALQTIAFRPDWQPWYEAVSARPNDFQAAIKKYREEAGQLYNFTHAHYGKELQLLSGKKESDRDRAEDYFRSIFHTHLQFSDDLRIFLSSDLMATLLEQSNLDPYVSSLQSAAERPLRLKITRPVRAEGEGE
jgi:KAP family P-loop domain